MTKVIDNEPQWLAYCHKNGIEPIGTDEKCDELIILSSRLLHLAPRCSKFVVATCQQTVNEARAAYLAGALDYFIKDWTPSKLLQRLNRVEEAAGARSGAARQF